MDEATCTGRDSSRHFPDSTVGVPREMAKGYDLALGEPGKGECIEHPSEPGVVLLIGGFPVDIGGNSPALLQHQPYHRLVKCCDLAAVGDVAECSPRSQSDLRLAGC